MLHKHSILHKDKSVILVYLSCLCEGVLCVWSVSCKGVSASGGACEVRAYSLRFLFEFS